MAHMFGGLGVQGLWVGFAGRMQGVQSLVSTQRALYNRTVGTGLLVALKPPTQRTPYESYDSHSVLFLVAGVVKTP